MDRITYRQQHAPHAHFAAAASLLCLVAAWSLIGANPKAFSGSSYIYLALVTAFDLVGMALMLRWCHRIPVEPGYAYVRRETNGWRVFREGETMTLIPDIHLSFGSVPLAPFTVSRRLSVVTGDWCRSNIKAEVVLEVVPETVRIAQAFWSLRTEQVRVQPEKAVAERYYWKIDYPIAIAAAKCATRDDFLKQADAVRDRIAAEIADAFKNDGLRLCGFLITVTQDEGKGDI